MDEAVVKAEALADRLIDDPTLYPYIVEYWGCADWFWGRRHHGREEEEPEPRHTAAAWADLIREYGPALFRPYTFTNSRGRDVSLGPLFIEVDTPAEAARFISFLDRHIREVQREARKRRYDDGQTRDIG